MNLYSYLNGDDKIYYRKELGKKIILKKSWMIKFYFVKNNVPTNFIISWMFKKNYQK